MTKKIDLLKKLIQLANHNPSEHEANRAARKVCQLLEELKVNFTPGRKEEPFRPKSPYADGPRTWNDVTRSTEPFWRSTPPNPPRQPRTAQSKVNIDPEKERPFKEGAWSYRPTREQEDLFNETIRSIFEEETIRSIFEEDYERIFKSDKAGNAYNPFIGKKKPKPKRKLKCKHCGTIVETSFVGLVELFECSDCLWKDYKKERK